ncbi:hypothetical protein TL16_g09609 [Triparma laevis f. inornata]|uniref:Uncharacterized protein n=1 Tax=Triparma laevis f. inornata TaxID=1714386 RepID=A0A9W7B382_9STRA|nr:hypothetical protein TL16_g09609 [Triparma laevis f. inornata]
MAPTQNLDGTYTQADQLVGQSLLLLHKPLRLGSRVTSPEFSPLVGTVVHSPKGWVTVDFDPPNKEVLLKEDVIQCHGISLRLKPPTSQYVEKVVDLPVNGQGLTGFKVALVMRRPDTKPTPDPNSATTSSNKKTPKKDRRTKSDRGSSRSSSTATVTKIYSSQFTSTAQHNITPPSHPQIVSIMLTLLQIYPSGLSLRQLESTILPAHAPCINLTSSTLPSTDKRFSFLKPTSSPNFPTKNFNCLEEIAELLEGVNVVTKNGEGEELQGAKQRADNA